MPAWNERYYEDYNPSKYSGLSIRHRLVGRAGHLRS
jgi:hypothetical protein